MEIIYTNDEIADARTGKGRLDQRMTVQERLAIFGCAQPDSEVWAAVKTASSHEEIAVAVNLMVSKGLLSQARADEILA